ncbi:MAG: atpF [Phycisphaerales bacterium]|nr:atpF [Phycisphaerales bacterium]
MTALPLPVDTRPARRRAGLAALAALLLAVLAFAARPAVAAETHAAATAEHAESDPQLIPEPRAPQIITTLTTLVIFLGLVAILGKYAWGPIVGGLKAREDKIRRDIRDAEEARARAEATLKQYHAQLETAQQQVRDLLTKASADAQQLATSIRANAQQEAEEAKERATKDIEAAKNQAVAEIYDQAAVLGTTIAEKILRRNLNADDQRDLVRSSLEQVKSVNAN